MTLPERNFHHPVARAIIDQRKELANDPALGRCRRRNPRRPEQRPALFRDDTRRLSRRCASPQQRLRADNEQGRDRRGRSSCCGTPRCASRTARMSLAERDLRRLQQKLQDALAKGAPDAEIERLMQRVARRRSTAICRRSPRNMQRTCPSRRRTADRSVAGDHQPRSAAHARPRPRAGAQRRARPGPRTAVAAAEHAGKPAHGAARARCSSSGAARRSR